MSVVAIMSALATLTPSFLAPPTTSLHNDDVRKGDLLIRAVSASAVNDNAGVAW